MQQLAHINHEGAMIGLNDQARALIDQFEANLLSNLQANFFASTYSSLDDILINKYHLSGIDKMDFPDFSHKTEFISKGVRGNIQKAEGKILTYKEAEEIMYKGIQEEMP